MGSLRPASWPELLPCAAPPAEPGALDSGCLERRRVVEGAAAFGLPLPVGGAVAVASLAGPAQIPDDRRAGQPNVGLPEEYMQNLSQAA